jgi:hypothetical protein
LQYCTWWLPRGQAENCGRQLFHEALRVHSSTKSKTRLDQSKNFSANLKAIELQDAANDFMVEAIASGRKVHMSQTNL